MSKNPTAFAQMDMTNTNKVIQALGAVIDAAGFSSKKRRRRWKQGTLTKGEPAEGSFTHCVSTTDNLCELSTVNSQLRERVHARLCFRVYVRKQRRASWGYAFEYLKGFCFL